MAKIKEQTEPKELTYEELHNKDLSQVIKESREVEEEKEEKKKVGEKENKIEEKAKEVKVKRETKVKEEVVEKVSKAVKDALIETTKAKEDEILKQQQEAAKKEELEKKKTHTPKWKTEEGGIPKSYDDIYEEAKNHAKEEILAELEERDARRESDRIANENRVKTETEAQTKAKQEYEERINNTIQSDLNELFAENKLPKVVKADDPEDPGIKAQKELFRIGQEVNQKRIAEGKPVILDIKRIFYENQDKIVAKSPAGTDLPIMGSSGVTTEDEPIIPLEKLRKMSFSDIFKNALKNART